MAHLNLPSEPRPDLNCLVLEDDISALCVFPVEIAKSKTVGGSKETIKDKKHAFDDIYTDRLDLWKVSIPDDQTLEENISKFDFNEQSLLLMEELSEVFSESPV